MITLTVGPNKTYQSIQEAVNAVILMAINNGGSLSQSIEIVVYEGIHGGLIIPPSSLGGSSTATVTVKAAPNNKVTMSGWNVSPANGSGHRAVGIGLGENNPYFKVRGIRTENFHKGIVFSANCNYSEIQNCYTQLCSNVGIWIYRSNYCSVVNSAVLDCDFNLVLSDVDDAFIAHNDLVKLTDPPSSAGGDKCVVHLTTTTPTSTTPPGVIVMYNNNMVASGGSKLICYGANVLNKLRSDNNNIYNPGGVIASSLLQGSSTPDVNNLAGWQALSNGDFGSISEYPPYLIAQQAGSSLFTSVDLTNFPSFGGVGGGIIDLCNASTASTTGGSIPHGLIPQYADSSLLCETLQSNFSNTNIVRPNPPAIGAYDTLNDPNGFGSSVVPVGVPGSGTGNSACEGGVAAGIATIEEKYGQSVGCINPAVVPGFFYIHDIQHYLYSSKFSTYIEDVTVTDIVLGARPNDEIKVMVSGVVIPNENWRIDRNVLRLYHRDLGITDFDTQVEISASVLVWKGKSFVKESFHQISRLRDGDTRYILEHEPTRGAPMVITDDKVNYADDATMLGWEFRTVWNELEDKVELEFGNPRNLIENPQFDYEDSETTGSLTNYASNMLAPDNWGIFTGEALVVTEHVTSGTGTTGVVAGSGSYTGQVFDTGSTGSYNLYPLIGDNFCMLSGEIRQRVRVDSTSPYWLSLYSAGIKNTGSMAQSITGDLTVNIEYYDIEMRELTGGAVSTGFSFSTDYTLPNNAWTRNSVKISNTNTDKVNKSTNYTPLAIPDNAFYMDVRLVSTGVVGVDAVSVTASQDLKDYSRRIRGREATLEYDTGLSDLYHVDDLTITPIRNRNTNGFMYIGPVPAQQFDQSAPNDTTTLTDWGWATGRLDHLPWARVSGKNKLRNRGYFSLNSQGQSEDVTLQPTISYPEEIQLIPRVPVSNLKDGLGQYEQFFSSGNFGVGGTDFTIRVTDDHGNPYAFEWVDAFITDDLQGLPSESYLGLLGWKDLGYYREFSNPLSVQLDSAGAAVIRWVPPGAADAMYECPNFNAAVAQDDVGDWYIGGLPYRINEAGHGNAFISTVTKPNGYPTRGTEAIEETLGVKETVDGGGDVVRIYSTDNTPHRETMELWVNHTGAYSSTGAVDQVYDLKLTQSDIPEIVEGEYFVDEIQRLIFVRWNGISNNANHESHVRYYPRYTYVKASADGYVDDRKLYIHDHLKTTLTNDIDHLDALAINYDIRADILVKARSPIGMSAEYAETESINVTGGVNYTNIRDRSFNGAIVGKSIAKRVGIDATN